MKQIVKYYLVSIVACLIALLQIFQVNNGLTRWRGGGFGMYSEVHFSEKEIWIGPKGGLTNLDQIDSSDVIKKLATRLKLQPNNSKANDLLNALQVKNNSDTVILQMWKPHLDPQNLSFTKVFVYETAFPD